MIDANAVQHLNIKILLEEGCSISLDDTIVVFHRWIRDRVCPEMLIDVADYRHVTAGPGVVLIAHEANYSIDNREGRTGLLYNRKAALPGTFQNRLDQTYQSALKACERFSAEPCFNGNLRFNLGAMELFVNDRLLAPNHESTWTVLQPEIERYFKGYEVQRTGEPRDLFRVQLHKPVLAAV